MRAVISASYPVLIQTFVSTEATRYYLNGFYVHPDPNSGVRIVATDGHRLGVFCDRDGSWEGGSHEGMIVRLEKPALSLLKTKVPRHVTRWLIVEGILGENHASIVEGDPNGEHKILGTFHNVLIDGSFPDYHRVVPDIRKRKLVPQSFQMRYIQDFGKALDKIDGGRIRVISEVENGPALILTNRDDFFGVLMPHSPGWEASNTYPEFWTKRPEKAKPKLLPKPREASAEDEAPVVEEIPADLPVRPTAEIITLTPKSDLIETESQQAVA